MNLEELKTILNSDILSDEIKKSEIINSLSKDENVINVVMHILERERANKQELLKEMNLELARAHIYIDEIDFSNVKLENNKSFNRAFVLDSIAKFYVKYKDYISHSFNRFI